MSEFLSRFDFWGAEFSLAVCLSAAAIWLIVLGCAVSSIMTRPFSVRQRVIWLLVVLLLPVLGLAVYLPFSCREGEFTGLRTLVSGLIPKGSK